MLSAKYGVSTNRIADIWKEYYGGTTLPEARKGLKKELPITTGTSTTKKYVTPFATYSVKPSKAVPLNNPLKSTRASLAGMSIVNTPLKPTPEDKELDITSPESMTDREAQILVGQVEAGNDSPDVMQTIAQLIDLNTQLADKSHQLSERTLIALENAHELMCRRERRRRGRSTTRGSSTDTDGTDYEGDNIDDTEDDSTAAYRKTAPTRPKEARRAKAKATRTPDAYITEESEDDNSSVGGRDNGQPLQRSVMEQRGANSEGSYFSGIQPHNPSSIWQPGNGSMAQPLGQHSQARTGRPVDYGAGACPISRTSRDTGPTQRQVQGYSYESLRSEQTLPAAQHYPCTGRLQQGHEDNGHQQRTQPQQGLGVHLQGRGVPAQAPQGIFGQYYRPT